MGKDKAVPIVIGKQVAFMTAGILYSELHTGSVVTQAKTFGICLTTSFSVRLLHSSHS